MTLSLKQNNCDRENSNEIGMNSNIIIKFKLIKKDVL